MQEPTTTTEHMTTTTQTTTEIKAERLLAEAGWTKVTSRMDGYTAWIHPTTGERFTTGEALRAL